MVSNIRPQTVAFSLEDGLVLMRPGVNRLFVLNATASSIWSDYTSGLPPIAIATRLAQQFGITTGQVSQDVDTALSDWERQGLLDLPSGAIIPQETILTAAPFRVEASAVECAYRIAGAAFSICYGEPAIYQRLYPLLQHWVVRDAASPQTTFEARETGTDYKWIQDGRATLYCETLDALIQQALHRIVEYACQKIDWLAVFHAAALGDGASCIVMPGLSGSGKTTLAAALAQSGFEYLGDETIPLRREDGRIVPLPGPLCLKSGSWPVLAAYYPALDTWPVYHRWGQPVRYLLPRPADTEHSWAVQSLIFPRYVPGSATVLQPITAMVALQYLMAADVLLPQPLEAGDVNTFIAWLGEIPAYTLTYNKLDDAVTLFKSFCLKTHSQN